uniref:Uncharacterized protein n=1 Tax=Chelydra serpentina TaxID=8475 RepID=A0A8C3XVS5_CHESE
MTISRAIRPELSVTKSHTTRKKERKLCNLSKISHHHHMSLPSSMLLLHLRTPFQNQVTLPQGSSGGGFSCFQRESTFPHSEKGDSLYISVITSLPLQTSFFLFPFRCQSLFRHHLENDLVKRITGRKARRRVFGAINANKFNRFGTLCSPFHALATPEMQKLTLPQDLPMTPRMLRQGIVCSTESDLRSLPLTFPELDGEKTEEPSLSERKKPSVHMKTPLLPPLVKPTRASLSHSKKAKSFQFPSQFPQ